jgi:hypothetical protein
MIAVGDTTSCQPEMIADNWSFRIGRLAAVNSHFAGLAGYPDSASILLQPPN